jgi:hypothetical protein
VTHYQIYFLAGDDHVAASHDTDSDDAAAAISIAEQLLSHSPYLSGEVWQGNKLVARIALNGSAPPANAVSPEMTRH